MAVGHLGGHDVMLGLCFAMASKRKLLLGGYFASMQDSDGKARYLHKLSILDGFDLYESDRSQWLDDVDLWPSITHIHLAMYLLYTPSRYTGEDLLNYKSLYCVTPRNDIASYSMIKSGWLALAIPTES